MKHQQVVPDYSVMLNSSITCIILVASGWVLFRLIQAIILMPSYMAKQERLVNKLSEGFSSVNDEILKAADDEDDGEAKEEQDTTNSPAQGSELSDENIASPTPLKEKKKK